MISKVSSQIDNKPKSSTAISGYRPDIDGLRAIAIIAVVIYHAFPKFFDSGFIGVDIFFVLSGFLISSIIFTQLVNESFSFRSFYARRVRRIFPALIVVLLFCFIFGWFFLVSDEFRQLGKHISGGAAFVSNIMLWGESGYFDQASDSKPLLHLWSLGVEEQFYIFYPVILWFFWRFRVNFLLLLAVLSIGSFSLNIVTVSSDSVAAFYSPLTRVWELLIGGSLAYLLIFRPCMLSRIVCKLEGKVWFIRNAEQKTKRAIVSNITSFCGISILLASFYVIDSTTRFPGAAALLPVVATFLCISAGYSAWFNRYVLSNRILVSIGLISFPLYLWHWVLLVLPRLVYGSELSHIERSVFLTISVILSIATYFLIEKPLRFGSYKLIKTTFLSIVMLIVACIGYVVTLNDGVQSRDAGIVKVVNEGDIGHDEFHRYHYDNFFPCTPEDIYDSSLHWNEYVRCYQSKERGAIDVALIGDSHSEHLFIGVAETLIDYNVVNYVKNALPSYNNAHYRQIFNYIANDPNIKVVIMSAYWSFRVREIPDDSTLEEELSDTIDFLLDSGKVVYLVQDTPGFSMDPAVCKYQRLLREKNRCTDSMRGYSRRNDTYMQEFEHLVTNNKAVNLFRVSGFFCNAKLCHMNYDGTLLFRDSNHLNILGSKYLGKELALYIKNLSNL